MIRSPLVILGFIIILVLLGIRFNLLNASSSLEESINSIAPSVDLACPNKFTDEENQISFCLPTDYIQIPQDKSTNFQTSFGPSRYKYCSKVTGDYCWVYLLHYALGTDEIPTLLYGAPASLVDSNFITESGLNLKGYAFDRYRFGTIYILKLTNDKYAYFYLTKSHPKAEASEYQNHLKILKSIKLL